MDTVKKFNWFILACVFTCMSGCATFNTITEADRDSPIFFSGTRQNIHAINENKIALMKYNAKPQEYPLIDLTFSFVADLFISPLTGSMALYNEIFE
jgi:uncharacterized protein YceK